MNTNPAISIPIDRSKWTVGSQRSGGHYDANATEYEGIRWQCSICTQSFVFTPEQQRQAYEVEKRFVWYKPTVCSACKAAKSGSSKTGSEA
jgi:hypothetical protein